MEKLLELFLSGGLPFALILPDLLELDRAFPKSDLVALFLLYRRGQATMSQLAMDLGAPLSTVTGLVSRLDRRGLVSRQRDPNDRRAILVELTTEGRQIATRIQEALQGVFARIQSSLSAEELTQLANLVQKVVRALASPPPADTAQPETESKPRKIIIED
jgi:DNA-binding MarR family transcriptional regulator